MFWDRAEQYTKTFLEEAASALANTGAKVSISISASRLNSSRPWAGASMITISRGLTWERNHHWKLLSEFQRDKLAGWLKVSYEQYREAEAVLARCRGHLADAMKNIDLLLTPSALGEAPAGLTSTGDTSFNILSTWTYTPCVHLPVFTGPSGLPVGIQLIGHRNQDHRLLEGAQAVYRVFSKMDIKGEYPPSPAEGLTLKHLFQPFQPFNRCAPFKSLNFANRYCGHST